MLPRWWVGDDGEAHLPLGAVPSLCRNAPMGEEAKKATDAAGVFMVGNRIDPGR